MPRILIACVEDALRKKARKAFENHPEFEICGVGSNCEEAMQKAEMLVPDLVILELGGTLTEELVRCCGRVEAQVPLHPVARPDGADRHGSGEGSSGVRSRCGV